MLKVCRLQLQNTKLIMNKMPFQSELRVMSLLCFVLQAWTVSQITIQTRNLSKVSCYICDNVALVYC